MSRFGMGVMLGGAALLASGASSFGGLIEDLTITAFDGTDTGTYTLNWHPTTESGVWQMPADPITHVVNPIGINDSSGNEVARLTDLRIEYDNDPAVSLRFAVEEINGTGTIFTISSVTVGFPAIVNPQAFATAAVTATDNDSDGASVTGQYAASKAYQATYHSTISSSYVNWAQLVDPVVAPVDGSNTGSERQPIGTGRLPIADTADQIKSAFSFLLSANDQASGTSRFDIVPEPTTLALLGGSFMVFAMRRNRRTAK